MPRVTFTNDEVAKAEKEGLVKTDFSDVSMLSKNLPSLVRSYREAVQRVNPSQIRVAYSQRLPDRRVCFYFLISDDRGKPFNLQETIEKFIKGGYTIEPTSVLSLVDWKHGVEPGDLDEMFADSFGDEDSGLSLFDTPAGTDLSLAGAPPASHAAGGYDGYGDDEESTQVVSDDTEGVAGGGSWVVLPKDPSDMDPQQERVQVIPSGAELKVCRRSSKTGPGPGVILANEKSSVSRNHAVLKMGPGVITVQDLKSANKTRVVSDNDHVLGRSPEQVRPVNGSIVLQFGQVQVEFKYTG